MESKGEAGIFLNTEYPTVEITDTVHFVEGGFCIAAIVSGIPEDYEKTGKLIVHFLLPVPQTPAVCAPGMPHYLKPDKDYIENKTWHLKSDCTCAKRIPLGSSRLVVPGKM